MRLESYMGRQRTEARMVANFRAKYGGPEEVVIAMGDWQSPQGNRFRRPTSANVCLKELLLANGYSLFLVDEYRTSVQCSKCGDANVGRANCVKFLQVDNPRPSRNRDPRYNRILCHGLLQCQNCSMYWNRDRNASANIWRAARAALDNKARPADLSRANSEGENGESENGENGDNGDNNNNNDNGNSNSNHNSNSNSNSNSNHENVENIVDTDEEEDEDDVKMVNVGVRLAKTCHGGRLSTKVISVGEKRKQSRATPSPPAKKSRKARNSRVGKMVLY